MAKKRVYTDAKIDRQDVWITTTLPYSPVKPRTLVLCIAGKRITELKKH